MHLKLFIFSVRLLKDLKLFIEAMFKFIINNEFNLALRVYENLFLTSFIGKYKKKYFPFFPG